MAILLLYVLFICISAVPVIATYYAGGAHAIAFTNTGIYFPLLLLAYGTYKGYTIIAARNQIRFSPADLIGFGVLHIAIMVLAYSGLQSAGQAVGFIPLFFRILLLSALPAFGLFVLTAFGGWAVRQWLGDEYVETKPTAWQTLAAIGVGFASFSIALTALGSMGFYTIWTVALLIAGAISLSWTECIRLGERLITRSIVFANHKGSSFAQGINLELIVAELAFMMLLFSLGVNAINAVRPMPIGWDDLGVYMNQPRLFAENLKILPGVGMAVWQTITGIGFLVGSAPQAFFFNQLGGVLVAITLCAAFSLLMRKQEGTHNAIPFGILFSALLIATPMLVFQQAKDMKLDPALLAFSVIALTLAYDALRRVQEKQTWEWNDIREFGIVGLVTGLAFAVKFTSLMLIVGLGGAIAYAFLGVFGFLGFFGVFIAAFTGLGLWDFLNVFYNKTNTAFVLGTTGVSAIIGAIFLGLASIKQPEFTRKALVTLLVFGVGISITVAPWLIKNTVESAPNITLNGILWGKGDVFSMDYTKLYPKTEVERREKLNAEGTSEHGTTTNEDYGRYFGYEAGLNNYLKLPRNLTLQSNQGGEYTDISYIYLALLPVSLVLLPFINPLGWAVIALVSLTITGFYFVPMGLAFLTTIAIPLTLPAGYGIILAACLLPLVFFHFTLAKTWANRSVFLINTAFAGIFVFLFAVSSYGIVWYGIAMYVSFLLSIALAWQYATAYQTSETDEKDGIIRTFAAVVFVVLVGIFFARSAIPAGFSNLLSSGYQDFKAGQVTQAMGVFESHWEYFPFLSTLNIDPTKHQTVIDAVMKDVRDPIINGGVVPVRDTLLGNLNKQPTLKDFHSLLLRLGNTDLSAQLDALSEQAFKAELDRARDHLYRIVLSPNASNVTNNAGIYRVGTFLTYFIANNHKRYYEDNILDRFDRYFYDQDLAKTVQRMKTFGLKYLLVDLNAATIDRDPRHDLTRRYENLLATFQSKELTLIDTDSFCLSLAVADRDTMSPSSFVRMAGVNSESYIKDQNGQIQTVKRTTKLLECYDKIVDITNHWDETAQRKYPFLEPIVRDIQNRPEITKDSDALLQYLSNRVDHGWAALFEIK